MTEAEQRELQRTLAALLAEPDRPLDAGWRRAANLLASSKPDATARLLRHLVAARVAAAAVEAAGPPADAAAAVPGAARPDGLAGHHASVGPTGRHVVTLAAGVGAGVVGGGLVLAGLDALLGDDADLPDLPS